MFKYGLQKKNVNLSCYYFIEKESLLNIKQAALLHTWLPEQL